MIDVDCIFFLLCPHDDYIPSVNYSAQSNPVSSFSFDITDGSEIDT